jgi:hypothetical protein
MIIGGTISNNSRKSMLFVSLRLRGMCYWTPLLLLTGDIPYDVSLRSPPTADTDEAASSTAAAGAAGATAAEAGKTTATGNAAAGKADGKASPVAPATAGKDTGKK